MGLRKDSIEIVPFSDEENPLSKSRYLPPSPSSVAY